MFKRHILAATFAAAGVLGLSNGANAFTIMFDSQGLMGPSFASSITELTVPVSTPITTASDSSNNVLGALDLATDVPISTPDGVNQVDSQGLIDSNGALFAFDDSAQFASVVYVEWAILPNITVFGAGTGGSDFPIDNIGFGQPTLAVPEPATWVMMIIGFGLVGFQLRRRSAIAA